LGLLRLRDRDAIVTEEGLIFRVFGNLHPRDSLVCDIEYAPSTIFVSNNPKAVRTRAGQAFYKLYEDEGWRFLKQHYPQYLIFNDQLQKNIIGVQAADARNVRKPKQKLEELLDIEEKDNLVSSMSHLLELVIERSGLKAADFGVFGSMMHDFHHPALSDIDLVVYGKRNASKLGETLQQSYSNSDCRLRNEFETTKSVRGKCWRFRNYSLEDFVRHQKRKLIYGIYKSKERGDVKVEFEPVKSWSEINEKYDPDLRIVEKGWVSMTASVENDTDGPFMPSVYLITPTSVLSGMAEALEVQRVISYMEEFRLQARKGEKVHIEGNLERVVSPKEAFYQVALTYCPRYYEQVLKVLG
jgi:predicted nucleotidyltransferase